jgi:hypothetical protein
LFDRGNSFDLDITYEYYDGVLTEGQTQNTAFDDETPPPDLLTTYEEPPYLAMILNTGCGRFV